MEAITPRFEAKPFPAFLSRRNGIRICIIGGGGTAAGIAYDLALRGFSVTILEKGELTSGTTGRHHGQLHCGARYAWSDPVIARECYEESLILSRIAPSCIEYNGGLFIALDQDDRYRSQEFLDRCNEAGIPAKSIDTDAARKLEPAISPSITAAVAVPDGSFDAFRLPLMFFSAARSLGASILPWHEVVGIDTKAGRVESIAVRGIRHGERRDMRIEADFFINATGAWAASIGTLAGIQVPVIPAAGALVAIQGRLVQRVISRLRPPGDGDIIVPQRALTIIGTTQRRVSSPEGLLPKESEVEFLMKEASLMVPEFASRAVYAQWAAARPLAGRTAKDDGEGRTLSRDFQLIDHEKEDGLGGIATILGGKATVLRAMGEKVSNYVCAKTAVSEECRTWRYALPSWRSYYRQEG
jgi:glycerol-3-phosphate dehydrogenase